MVDIHSNEYIYENSFVEFNRIYQCQVISINSPHGFTIQLHEQFHSSEEFFRNLKYVLSCFVVFPSL